MTTPSPAAGPIRLRVNPALAVSAFDSDAEEDLDLCELPDRGGVKRYTMPKTVVRFLRTFDGTRTVDDAIRLYLEEASETGSESRLRTLVDGFLVPRRFLVPGGSASLPSVVEPPSCLDSKKLSYLSLKVPLLTPRLVGPLARRLSWLYSVPGLAAGLLLFVTVQVAFFTTLGRGASLDIDRIRVENIPIMLTVALAGVFFHELGHASAAARFGCSQVEIGFGIYLFYGVFYADVTEAWRLPRGQRVVVDLGGIYFQSIFMAAVLAAFNWTGSDALLVAFFFLEVGIVRSLNPFLRLDGYWVMSDLFGIPNLRRQSLVLTSRLCKRLIGIPREELAGGLRLSRRATWSLTAYLVFGTMFLVYFLHLVFTRFLVKLFQGYPEWVLAAHKAVTAGEPNVYETVTALLEVGWRSVAIVGLSVVGFRGLTRVAGWLLRLVERRRSATSVLGVR